VLILIASSLPSLRPRSV